MRSITWSFDARSDLVSIVANQIYTRIRTKVAEAVEFPEGFRVVPELQDVGVFEIREIVVAPWRIFFRTSATELRILSVIDGRRNIAEILYQKMMDGRLGS